jgi:hypothetical protein
MKKLFILLTASALGAHALAQDYDTAVVASGLTRPTGIAVNGSSTLFITELPTPGIGGGMGGQNRVSLIQLGSGKIETLTVGEPEPTNLALDKHGTLYWTCKSAGVILERRRNGDVGLFLGGLASPSGIAVDPWDNVFFTQVPTPGVPGGANNVVITDGVNLQEISGGEPEPSDIAVARNGTAYWTCTTAGVILCKPAEGPRALLLSGLSAPKGIAIDHQGRRLYWTEVPTPGQPGSMGGMNRVRALDLATMEISLVDFGDPEPTDIAVASNGDLYWTCTSAGVVVRATRRGGN